MQIWRTYIVIVKHMLKFLEHFSHSSAVYMNPTTFFYINWYKNFTFCKFFFEVEAYGVLIDGQTKGAIQSYIREEHSFNEHKEVSRQFNPMSP
jgi:hypothetical protein